MSAYMLITHKDHNNTMQVYSVTVMTHVIALEAGQSTQGTFAPITPVFSYHHNVQGPIRAGILTLICC